MNHPTFLYRLYDDSGQLLYIGISNSPIRRGSQHIDRQPWAHQVRRQEWSNPYPTREAALEAERQAIIAEQPRYNIVHGKAHPVVIEHHAGLLSLDVDGALHCPICGFTYTHISLGSSQDDNVIIFGTCEDGCEFTLQLVQRKGKTIVTCVQGSAQ